MAHERIVAFVSRSGTSAAAAAFIADRLDADLHDLAPRRYDRGLGGLARIAGDTLHLSRGPSARPALAGRRLVVLVGPIWFLAPARPLHDLVRAHDLRGADVLAALTMTTACCPLALRLLHRDIDAAGGRCLGVRALRVRPGDPLPDLLAPLLSDLHLT